MDYNQNLQFQSFFRSGKRDQEKLFLSKATSDYALLVKQTALGEPVRIMYFQTNAVYKSV